ncbi:MAG: adenylate/guanylate cyclase domain-containing protein [Terracidiphilus sp.]|jgi:class 3 adenylate cyclase
MPETVTIPAKYVFLDVIAFTHNRSVEAQTEIVEALNNVVLDAISANNVSADSRILLPTGDGICLALLNIERPYDIHVRVGLSIIKGVEKSNAAAIDEQRKFKVRIGINSNVDNLITDINGHRNIAGAGINLAQRVMSIADGNQILVGQPVFDTLSQREKYMCAFRPYFAQAKHGLTLSVYQLVMDGFPGLDVTTPSQFRRESPAEEKLPEIVAYYMAHAMVHRAEMASHVERNKATYSFVVLLWLLAHDSRRAAHKTPLQPKPMRYTDNPGGAFLEQFEHYDSQDFWICAKLSDFIVDHELENAIRLFEGGGSSSEFGAHFVTPEGQNKLKKDWPNIWEELNLEAHSNLGPREPDVLGSAKLIRTSSESMPTPHAPARDRPDLAAKSKRPASKPKNQMRNAGKRKPEPEY